MSYHHSTTALMHEALQLLVAETLPIPGVQVRVAYYVRIYFAASMMGTYLAITLQSTVNSAITQSGLRPV